jgi:hypothetical protein
MQTAKVRIGALKCCNFSRYEQPPAAANVSQ